MKVQKLPGIALALFLAFLAVESPAAQLEAEYMHATRFNVAGQITGTIAPDPDGGGPLRLLATRNTYNSSGLVIKVEAGELTSWPNETIAPSAWGGYGFSGTNIFSTKEFVHDTFGNVTVELTRGRDGTPESLVQFNHNVHNSVRCKAVRMNKAAFAPPYSDACTPGPEGSDGPDRITRYNSDIFGQVWSEERGVGTSLEHTYVSNTWLLRTLTKQVDANGNRTDLRHDSYGRLKRRVYPAANAPGGVNEGDYNEYTYDANGNAATERKRSGATITYTYDANNRPTKKDLSSNTYGDDIEYDYDARGLTLYSRSFATPTLGVFNSFDGFGRLASTTSAVKVGTATVNRTLSYQYDANGNRTRVTHPDGAYFVYGFDGLNRVDCLAEVGTQCEPGVSGTKLLTVEYGPDGRRQKMLRPGAATTNYAVDNANRLQSFGQDFSGTADDLTNTFAYNPAGQIKQLVHVNSLYAYVGNGNRAGSYTPDGLNRYGAINGYPVSYDANGNLTAESYDGYTYDMENRLVVTSGTIGSLKYDPVGRLSETAIVPSATTQFLYDGDALVAEYSINGNSASLTRRYVHGNQVDEPWVQYNITPTTSARRYLHADHQGSIVAFSDSSGTVTNKLAYDVYGIPKGANQERFGYTGQVFFKEFRLYYYKARIYSPTLGRFLQTDPIFYSDSMNMYAYVGNDPLNKRDPTGLKCQTTQETGASCTVDTFKDKKGNEISRADATAKKGDARRIERLEARMTAKYEKAQSLAARNGSVTIKGDGKKIADQKVSGQQVVGAMETTNITAAAGSNPLIPNSNASTDGDVYADGSIVVRGITFWTNGRNATSQTFGHEALHVVYYALFRANEGWNPIKDQNLHQNSFDNAAEDIR